MTSTTKEAEIMSSLSKKGKNSNVITDPTQVPRPGPRMQDGEICIVKFREAHCYIGRVYMHENYIRMTYPKCIRRWGTTNGLGELYNGPLSSTVLDLSPELEIPMLAVNCIMRVNQEKWANHIAKSEQGGD